MDAEQAEVAAVRTEPVRYAVDPRWYEQRGRDFAAFAAFRFCPSCRQQVGTEREERVPTADPNSGKVDFKLRRVPFGSNPFSVVRDCCSKRSGYLSASLPLRELIFRVFLASGNQPMTAEALKAEIEAWTAPSDRARLVGAETLQRLLEHEGYYGFQPVDEASAPHQPR